MRSIGAIGAGYIVFAISAVVLFQAAGQSPDAHASTAFKIGSTLYGCLFALIGGMLAVRLAPRRPASHAVAVAILIAAGAMASLVYHGSEPVSRWSQIAALTLMAPCAAIGGAVLHYR